ncbi:MAG TPA: hypothetical protein VHL57_10455, partial [Flavobacteriales bacterium]|nr:hypothetical protein [Flavobacteriales bacterium]
RASDAASEASGTETLKYTPSVAADEPAAEKQLAEAEVETAAQPTATAFREDVDDVDKRLVVPPPAAGESTQVMSDFDLARNQSTATTTEGLLSSAKRKDALSKKETERRKFKRDAAGNLGDNEELAEADAMALVGLLRAAW